MNNHVTFAAAGHGKTYSLCSQAKLIVNSTSKHVLVISYTNEGIHSLETEYRKQNGGILTDKVVFKSWYSMLLSEFIKPYQCSLQLKWKHKKKDFPFSFPENFINSIAFYNTKPQHNYYNHSHVQYFINEHNDVIPDRASHLAYICNKHSNGNLLARLEGLYSHIFIDELQDYAGWDLEIIRLLFCSQLSIQCVGDYKQSTYRTNNSQKNSRYRDDKIIDYFRSLEKEGLCNISYANTTRRFNQQICNFVNTIQNDTTSLIEPDPTLTPLNSIDNCGVFLIATKYLSEYCTYYQPTILRYQKNAKINFQHNCDVFNYGSSKGATYDRVVVIPVSTVLPFINQQTKITSNQTRAKFYVACTRARHSVIFAIDNPKENDFFVPVELHLGNKIIPAYKFQKKELFSVI